MACMTHFCADCNEEWFDNRVVSPCLKCGKPDRGVFDETPDDGRYDDDPNVYEGTYSEE